jgi:hypothetical protein
VAFVKHAILLFPSDCRHPPLTFLKYYRARSDGWEDGNRCQLCSECYQEALRPFLNCELPPTCRCNICKREPPSLRDLASNVLFKCVLDLERFELTCFTTYSQYKFAVESGRVDELHLLPPNFPRIVLRFRFTVNKGRFHSDCQDGLEWDTRMEGIFAYMKSAIDSLVSNEHQFWCRHCQRGLFFFPNCEHGEALNL